MSAEIRWLDGSTGHWRRYGQTDIVPSNNGGGGGGTSGITYSTNSDGTLAITGSTVNTDGTLTFSGSGFNTQDDGTLQLTSGS